MAITWGWSTIQNKTPNLFQTAPTFTSWGSTSFDTKPQGVKTLFINERNAMNAMIADWIEESTARNEITKKRKSLLWKISQEEWQALVKMAADDIDINEAISFVKKRRNDNLPLWKKAAKIPFNLSVWATSLASEQVGNALDFFTWGQSGFWEQVEGIKQVTDRSFKWETGFQAGRNILWVWELAAVSPTKLAWTFWWRVAQWAVIWGWIGWVEPILSKGSDATAWDIATGAAIGWVLWAAATPLVEKLAIPAIAWTIAKSRWLIKKVWEDWVSGSVWDVFTRDIPESVIMRDLKFNPNESKKVKEILGKTEAEYVLEKGLWGQWKEETAEFFIKNADEQYNGITKALKNAWDEAQPNQSAEVALEDMLEQLTSSKKLATFYADDIAAIKDMLARGKYTWAELNAIRRSFDRVNTWLFTAQGKAKAWIETNVDISTRAALNDAIEEIGKTLGLSIKEMNKELRASIVMKDALLRRFNQEQRNNFIGLQDIGVSAILGWWNPAVAIGIVWAKKFAEWAIPKVAQKAFNIKKVKDAKINPVPSNTRVPNTRSTSSLGLSNTSRSVSDNIPTTWTKATQKSWSNAKQVKKTTVKNPTWVMSSKKVNLKDTKIVDKLYNTYKARNKGKTVVLDTDEIKKMFTDFDKKAPEKVHKESSDLSKNFFKRLVKELKGKKVVLTAWGGWSWKSEVLIADLKAKGTPLVFDGTLKDYDKTLKTIKIAQEAWKEVEINAVYVDYGLAKMFNSKRDRTVPEALLRSTHTGYRQTLIKLLKNNPDVKVTLKQNLWYKDSNWKAVAIEVPNDKIIGFLESRTDLD